MVTAKRNIPRSPTACRTALAAGLALAATVFAAGPVAPASAQGATRTAAATTPTGSSRLALEGKGVRGLRKLGVKLAATKPVRVSRTALVLPVSTGALASTVRLDSKGTLVMRRGKRRLKLTALQVKLARKGSVTAKLGKRRITLFRVTPAKGKAMRINAATGRATLQSAKVTLPAGAGRRIRRALKLRRTPSGSFGTVTVIATFRPGRPIAKPLPGPEPPVLARPASAVDVTVNGIVWEPRTSFVNYMNTQPAPNGGVYPSGGAAAAPGEGNPAFRFTYRPLSGWWDAASQTAALYYAGTLNFRFFSHGIDIDTSNPEIELNGPASRAIFRLGGRRSTPYGNKRGVLVNLDPTTTVAPRCATAGKTVTCNDIPAKVPADAGQSVFAGFYQPGDQFGDISVSFTTP